MVYNFMIAGNIIAGSLVIPLELYSNVNSLNNKLEII
jgi:hypothetical protein